MFNKNRFIWLLIYISIFVHLVTKCDFFGLYGTEFFVLLIGYITVGGIFCLIVVKGVDIFEPLPLTLLLLIGLFSIAPIELTAKGTVTLAGVNFMGGCVKVTFLYIFSSIAIVIGYYYKKMPRVSSCVEDLDFFNKKIVFILLLAIWFFSIVLGYWFLYKVRGMNFNYIISLGTQGTFSLDNTTDASINFILNFSYSSIVPWLYFIFYYKNKVLKVVSTFLMIALFLVCGWRNVVIIMVLSAVCMYFMKNGKRPSGKQIMVAILGGLIFLGIMGAIRGNLRTGVKVENSVFELNSVIESVTYSLETNFNLYQPFYAIAKLYPSKYMYSLGKAIFFDTLVTIIPRVIWPNKPLAWNNSLNTAMRRSTADIVVTKYGMAVPSLGEYYVDFGFVGTILFCVLMGIILKNQTRFFRKKNRNICDLIRYSVTYGVLFVLVMRGATPNNFYYLIFLMWPNIVVRYFVEKEKKYV